MSIQEKAMQPAPMDIGIPAGMEISDHLGLRITHRWYSPKYIFLAFFAVFWNGFLVVWYSMAGASGNLVMLLFPLLHVAVGFGVAYTAITGFVNRTTIRIYNGQLTIQHGPLPWPGNCEVPARDLEQLYCKKNVSHSKNGSTTTYAVQAILKNRRNQTLLKGLESSEQALFIEQEIEKHLGIENVPVRGEMT